MSFNPDDTLKDFPCTFNLTTGRKVSHQRLRHIKDKVIEDLECSDSSLEEKIRDLNLLTWVIFCLDDKVDALEKNTEVLNMTGRKNITSLGNFIYISCGMGDKIEASQIYKELLGLTHLAEFDELKTAALAEQAYSYSRLGGHENYILSRDLFEECILKFPNNNLWKYGLGLACKRLTNWNIQCTSSENIDIDQMRLDSIKMLFDVADNGDESLKGLAYAQLVNLRQNCMQPKYDLLFNRHSIHYLCTKALEFGAKDPAVLTQCGKSLKSVDLDRSISLLRKSISLRESTIAYHHLGICLIIKAKCESRRALSFSPRRRNFDSSGSHSVESLRKPLLKYNQERTTGLHHNNRVVQEAIQCFQEAIKLSHGENVPAITSLGDAYRSVRDYQSALAQYSQIIDQNGSKFNGNLIHAHTAAGECLHLISKTRSDSADLVNESNEQFIKAISIAVDLIARKPECEQSRYVWTSISTILDKVPQLPLKKGKNRLFELVKSYRDKAGVLKLILHQVFNLQDYGTFKKELNAFLDTGRYEEALAFLKIVDTNSDLAQSNFSPSVEMIDMKSRVYFAALWSRLVKGSADSTRVFQQLFQLRYGQCVGLVSDDDSESVQTKYCDVVIFADDKTSQLARTLCGVFKSVYGIETIYKSKNSIDHCDLMADGLCMLMEICSLFLVVLDDKGYLDFEKIKQIGDKCPHANILLVNWGQDNLNRDNSLNLDDEYWAQTKLLMTSLEKAETLTGKYAIQHVFQGNHEAVIRLFCFLVGENFDRRREQCHTSR